MAPVLITVNAKVPPVVYKALRVLTQVALLSYLHPTNLRPVPQTQQAYFCPRVLALNSLYVQNVPPPDIHTTTPHFFQVLHQMLPSQWSPLTTLFNITSSPHPPH